MAFNAVTEPVKEIKMYLRSYGTGGISQEALESGVMKVLKNSAREDHAFLHMALFFHVGLDSTLMDYLQDNPDDFVGLLPPIGYSGMKYELYSRLVMEGGLANHFFQMLMALPKKYNVGGAVTATVDLMSSNVDKYYDFYVVALMMLVKLSRPQGENEDNQVSIDLYHKCLMKLVKSYVEFEGISRHEKLSSLLRLGGVACMMKEEYECSTNDLGELLEEHDFDTSRRFAINTNMYFEKLFANPNPHVCRNINPATLEFLSDTLKELNFSKDEAEVFKSTKKTSKVSWLDYIGVTAFLMKSIFEKRVMMNEDIRDKIETLLNQSILWSKHRPKLTMEDYANDITDFNQFILVIRKFGHKEKLRYDLLNKFLNLSYSDIYLKRDGLRITDKYLIPGATYDIALNYIRKSMDSDLMPSGLLGVIPEIVKIAILKMVCTNENVRVKRDDIVGEIFRDGSHTLFSRSSYSSNVTQVCTMLGSMENETGLKSIEHNRDLIFNICFQNPSSALESLLTQSIRSHKFKALEVARPFFSIPSSETTLLEDCFKRILNSVDEGDPLVRLIETVIPSLLDHKILSGDQIFGVLKAISEELLDKPESGLEKLENIFQLLKSLAEAVKSTSCNNMEEGNHHQKQVLQDIGDYGVEMFFFTCDALNKKIVRPMINIRRSCYSMMSITETEIPDDLALEPDEQYTLEFLGLLYIRAPKLRPQIVALIDQVDSKSIPLEEGLDHVITWVINSEPTFEWESCIQLIQCVIYPKFCMEWTAVTQAVSLVNFSTHVVFQMSTKMYDHHYIREWLKFYKLFVKKTWKKKLEENNDGQLSILETLVGLSISIQKAAKMEDISINVKKNLITTMQQLLLLVLDMVGLMTTKRSELDAEFKDQLLNFVSLLPHNDVKYVHIYRCITERVLKQNNSKILVAKDDVEEGEPEGSSDQQQQQGSSDPDNVNP